MAGRYSCKFFNLLEAAETDADFQAEFSASVAKSTTISRFSSFAMF